MLIQSPLSYFILIFSLITELHQEGLEIGNFTQKHLFRTRKNNNKEWRFFKEKKADAQMS